MHAAQLIGHPAWPAATLACLHANAVLQAIVPTKANQRKAAPDAVINMGVTLLGNIAAR